MELDRTDTVVIGGGQSGIAMSEHLSELRIPHVVLERKRIAERWRSERWDSLVANGPAWHDRFPGLAFEDLNPDSFPSKERMADYLEEYARRINAPIRTGVEVTRVRKAQGRPGFVVSTTDGTIEAERVVVATGPFQVPFVPDIVPADAGVMQVHSSAYKNPDQVPQGAVLVVGGGASGAQIAEELHRAGRTVFLSIGEHYRPPRSYRGRDYVWWLGVLGKWDEITTRINASTRKKHVAFAVSGYDGGKTVDFRQFAAQGITLVGKTLTFADGKLQFGPDLAENLAEGDRAYLDMLREADDYVIRNGIDLPPDPDAWTITPSSPCIDTPITELDLKAQGISAIVWATGFRFDFSWLEVDVLDDNGMPVHKRGITGERGIYFLGLPELTNRASSFIYGCWYDAKYIATHIGVQRNYSAYQPA